MQLSTEALCLYGFLLWNVFMVLIYSWQVLTSPYVKGLTAPSAFVGWWFAVSATWPIWIGLWLFFWLVVLLGWLTEKTVWACARVIMWPFRGPFRRPFYKWKWPEQKPAIPVKPFPDTPAVQRARRNFMYGNGVGPGSSVVGQGSVGTIGNSFGNLSAFGVDPIHLVFQRTNEDLASLERKLAEHRAITEMARAADDEKRRLDAEKKVSDLKPGDELVIYNKHYRILPDPRWMSDEVGRVVQTPKLAPTPYASPVRSKGSHYSYDALEELYKATEKYVYDRTSFANEMLLLMSLQRLQAERDEMEKPDGFES